MDFTADFDARVVLDAANCMMLVQSDRADGGKQHTEHGTYSNDSDPCVSAFTADDHNTASVFAEDIKSAFFVDGLRVDSIVCSWNLGDAFNGAGDRRVPAMVVLRSKSGNHNCTAIE